MIFSHLFLLVAGAGETYRYNGSVSISVQLRGTKLTKPVSPGETFEIVQTLKDGIVVVRFPNNKNEYLIFKNTYLKIKSQLSKMPPTSPPAAATATSFSSKKPSPPTHAYREPDPSMIESDVASISRETVTYGGKQVAQKVDLKKQFRPFNSVQRGGTCHVFAGAALVEAFCKKEVKVDVDISEAFLIYLHLMNRAKNTKTYNLGAQRNLSGGFTTFDGGPSIATVHRIQQGYVCTEKEFPLFWGASITREFAQTLGDLGEKLGDLAEQESGCPSNERKQFSDRALATICTTLEEGLQTCKLPEAPVQTNSEVGKYIKTMDPNLLKCLQHGITVQEPKNFNSAEKDKSLDAAIALLNQQKPFICGGNMAVGVDQLGNTIIGGHAIVVHGYEFVKPFEPGKRPKIVFTARDPNRLEPVRVLTEVNVVAEEGKPGTRDSVRINFCDTIIHF